MIAALLLFFVPKSADPFCGPKYWLLSLILFLGLYGKQLAYTRMEWPALLYLTSVLISSLFGNDPWLSIFGLSGDHFTGLLPSITLYCAYHYGIKRSIVNELLWASVAVSVIAVAQKFYNFMPFETFAVGRTYSTLGSPVYLSCLLAMVSALAIARKRPLFLLAYIPALVTTQSRSGMLALIAGSLIALISSKTVSKLTQAGLLCSILAVGGVIAFTGHISQSRGQSDRGRLYMGRVAIDSIMEHPVLGIGPEQFFNLYARKRTPEMMAGTSQTYNNAYCHNSVLEVLVGQGAVGLILMLLVFGVFWQTASVGAKAAGVALFVYSLFQPTPLPLKALLAMIYARGQSVDGEVAYSKVVKIALALIVLATSCIVISGRLNYAARRMGDTELLWQSIQFQPTLLH